MLGRNICLVEYTLYRLLKEGRRNGFGVTERGRRGIYIPAQGRHRNTCSRYTTFISWHGGICPIILVLFWYKHNARRGGVGWQMSSIIIIITIIIIIRLIMCHNNYNVTFIHQSWHLIIIHSSLSLQLPCHLLIISSSWRTQPPILARTRPLCVLVLLWKRTRAEIFCALRRKGSEISHRGVQLK